MSNKALVIVDVQEKLLNVMHGKDALVKSICVMLKSAILLDIPVINCRQYPQALGDTAAEINDILTTEPVDKRCFSCAGSEEFIQRLNQTGCEDVILCGIETHVCVYQTARDLLSAGFGVHLLADAVTSRNPDNKRIAIERMAAEGITISSVEMTLFELLETSEHPCFRNISKMIK